jgi:hypothetical protein
VAALGAGAERFKGYQDNVDFGKTLKMLIEGKGTQRETSETGPRADDER